MVLIRENICGFCLSGCQVGSPGKFYKHKDNQFYFGMSTVKTPSFSENFQHSFWGRILYNSSPGVQHTKVLFKCQPMKILSFFYLLYVKRWCFIIFVEVVCRDGCHIAIAMVHVTWRHNFNTGFVAAILDILVQ